jgi:hypothetical protein
MLMFIVVPHGTERATLKMVSPEGLELSVAFNRRPSTYGDAIALHLDDACIFGKDGNLLNVVQPQDVEKTIQEFMD